MRKSASTKKPASRVMKSVAKVNLQERAKPKKSLERIDRLLPKQTLLNMLDMMIKSRVLEERLIKVYKTGDAFFWIGGPGEEAFGVPLGMLALKGQGPDFDMMHLHYRCTPTLIAMGMTMLDSLRLIMNRATDPSTGGRNFCNHYCFPQWNILPVSSPIEVQYQIAIGTGIAQRRRRLQKKSQGISIITGGDAGTAEGDFASCLVWASRPKNELPLLITVQNNKKGISTDYETQHGEKFIADRGKAFGIRTAVINGNDPVEVYLGLKTEMDYIRKTGKPVLAEFAVSRLFGHSSASGANREGGECCIETFEKRLVDAKLTTSANVKEIFKNYDEESRVAAEQARNEPVPQGSTIWDHTYVGSENADWRKF